MLAVLRQMERVARGTSPANPAQVEAWMRILRNAAHPMHDFLPVRARKVYAWESAHVEGDRTRITVDVALARALRGAWSTSYRAAGFHDFLLAVAAVLLPQCPDLPPNWGEEPRARCVLCGQEGTTKGLKRHWAARLCAPLDRLAAEFRDHDDAVRLEQERHDLPGPPPLSAMEHVYLVACPATGQVKIGKARRVAARLAQLQTGRGDTLQLVATIPTEDALALEGELHRRFRQHRLKGEWFRDVPEIREAFA